VEELMQRGSLRTDNFSVELSNANNGDVPLVPVLSNENIEETDGAIANAAITGTKKIMDLEVSSAFLNGHGDREECTKEWDEMPVSKATCNEEVEDQDPSNDTFEKVGSSIQKVTGLCYARPTLNGGTAYSVGCPTNGPTSTSNSYSDGVPATGSLKLPVGLSPPRLLKADDDDVIDLLEDENPVTSAKKTHLNQLLSRFIDSVKAANLSEKTDSTKTVEYSIVTRVPDAQTGRLSIQLDTVAYKPNHSKAVTFTDRRMWARHRLELQAIMRSKRLRQYDERMRHYEGPHTSSKKSDSDLDEAEEWLKCDESDTSTETETEQEENEDGNGDEDEDIDENPSVSNIQKKVSLFVDDEAEENDDSEDCEVDIGASQQSATEICESLSSNFPAVVMTSQGLASRARVEPGEFDLFANDTTLLVDSTSVAFIHLESLKAHDTSRMIPFPHRENPAHCDVSSASILNRSWNGTPYSMLFSQKRIPLQDCKQVVYTSLLSIQAGISEYSLLENDKSSQNISNFLPSQTQVSLNSTQLTLSEDVINNDPDKKINMQSGDTQALGSDPETCLTHTQVFGETEKDRAHEFTVQSASSTQASLCTPGFSHNPQDASNISLFSNYDSQPCFLSDMQTTQANAKLSANNNTDFSTEMVDTQLALPTDPQYPSEPQKVQSANLNGNILISESRRRLKRLRHDSGGNLNAEADFEYASRRRTFFKMTQGIEGDGEMGKLSDESQAKTMPSADSVDILVAVGDEGEEGEGGDYHNFSEIKGVDGGTDYSSNSEVECLHIFEQEKSRPKYMPKDFIDEEAELSGDDAERAIYMDEWEDIDDDSATCSLKDFVDDEIDDRNGKLRREVERVYNRIQNDDDQRRIRYLKEMFFEDGDLYEEDGTVRRRRFRWRGLEKEDPFSTRRAESDEENEEDEEEGKVGGAGVFSALVSKGAGVMSRWLLQSSLGSLSEKFSTTECVSGGSKDTDTRSSVVKSVDGTSIMEFGGSSESFVSLSLVIMLVWVLAYFKSTACFQASCLGKKTIFSQRSCSHAHKESQRHPLDPLQRNISVRHLKRGMLVLVFLGKLANLTSGSSFLDSTGNSSQTHKSLPLTKHGSILSRSATLLPSSSKSNAKAARCACSHADEEVEVADLSVSDAGDTRIQIPGLSLRSKVGLSCFSMKEDNRTAAAPVPVSNRTHFTKSTSLQPLRASSRPDNCPTNPSSTNATKSKFRSVFGALV
uniref:Claspin n=1 Tax=Echinococcus canadensis TaxID=519352 RepID=A0A915EWA6_9CEST